MTTERDCETIFQYTRGMRQDESRLRGKRSVGIGGHISMKDSAPNGAGNAYSEGMSRELDEEVSIETPYREQCIGLINEDETSVGRVHWESSIASMLSGRPLLRGRAKSWTAVSGPFGKSFPISMTSKCGRRFACGRYSRTATASRWWNPHYPANRQNPPHHGGRGSARTVVGIIWPCSSRTSATEMCTGGATALSGNRWSWSGVSLGIIGGCCGISW